MSRIDIHTAPDRETIKQNRFTEPEGERIRAELEDFLKRNKIVSILLDTDEHVVDIQIVKLPKHIEPVLTIWGSVYVQDDYAKMEMADETSG